MSGGCVALVRSKVCHSTNRATCSIKLTKRMCRKLVWASPLASTRSTEQSSKRSNVLISIDFVAKSHPCREFWKITLSKRSPLFQLKTKITRLEILQSTFWERFNAVKIKISKPYIVYWAYIYHKFYFHSSNSIHFKKLILFDEPNQIHVI